MRLRRPGVIAGLLVFSLLLAACGGPAPDPGAPGGDTPQGDAQPGTAEPGDTPLAAAEPGDAQPGDGEPEDAGSAAGNQDFRLLAGEKVWPPDFHEVVQGDVVLVTAALDDSSMDALWSYFQLETERPSLDWDAEFALFLATGESGSCPLELKGVAYDAGQRRLILHITDEEVRADTPCTEDWTPRTFVVALPAALVEDIDDVQVQGLYGEPLVPFEPAI